jgi:hypothetical protein
LYDYVAFEEDNLDKFYAYEGDYAKIKETRSAIAWPWPGADAYLWTYEDLDAENFRVSHAYKDEEGREWVYIIIWDGFRGGMSRGGSTEGWVCMGNLENMQIPAFNPAPEPQKWQPDALATRNMLTLPLPLLIIIIVAALGLGTAVLIRVFRKPS